MPVSPTYPGVYIEEVPSPVRTITGVSTSVTAFVGYSRQGPLNQAVQIFNFGDYERIFGGLDADSTMSYAVYLFFLNGGTEAWVVRTASGARKADVELRSEGSANVLKVEAASAGTWGNSFGIEVNYDTTNPDSLFNLIVTEIKPSGEIGQQEEFRNLSMNSRSPRYVESVVNAGAKLIRVERLTSNVAEAGWSLSGDLSSFPNLSDETRFIAISVDGGPVQEVPIFPEGSAPGSLGDLTGELNSALNGLGVTATQANATGTDDLAGNYIKLTSSTSNERSSVQVFSASRDDAARILKLGLTNGGREREGAASLRPAQNGTTSGDLADLNLSQVRGRSITITVAGTSGMLNFADTDEDEPSSLPDLRSKLEAKIKALSDSILKTIDVQLTGTRLRFIPGLGHQDRTIGFSGDLASILKLRGAGGATTQPGHYPLRNGNDGSPPGANELKGNRNAKTGLYALEDVDLFNILCLPGAAELSESNAVYSEALGYCEERRAFLLVDISGTTKAPDAAKTWLEANANLKHRNAAVYFPRIQIADPLREYRPHSVPPSGAVAGLYARTDSARGVWKAPAGIDASLRGVQGVDYKLTDPETGVLNQLGINCLRALPVYGPVSWGARTLKGDDRFASEWKYIPVRRLALYLEESLYRGTQWVVFEPNDEPLWAQIRLNVGAFMHSLFRQGAFQGTTPRQAYFVKCDGETTTQDDINRGIVNILVGFAPLKPAEFVIIKISQIAGQVEV